MTDRAPTTFSEYDWFELIAFNSKVRSEGFAYALENYPPRFEDPTMRMVAADPGRLREHHAAQQTAIDAWWDAEPSAVDLINDHIDESDRRERDACLWGIRCTDGYVIACDTREYRDSRVAYLNKHRGKGWREPVGLLQRFVPAGEWNETRLPV